MDFLLALVAAIFISLLALSGLIFVSPEWTHKRELRLMGFAAGVLLATASLELLPQSVGLTPNSMVPYYAFLFGIVGFFFTERAFSAFHGHGKLHSHDKNSISSVGPLVLVGGGLHNMIDGVAIGIAFQISPGLGLATTLAIAAHELPHEIADYTLLLKSGFTRQRALLLNFISGLAAVAGVVAVYVFGSAIQPHQDILLASTAGFFLYIASADIIPELNHQHERGERFILPFILGLVLIAGLVAAMPHG